MVAQLSIITSILLASSTNSTAARTTSTGTATASKPTATNSIGTISGLLLLQNATSTSIKLQTTVSLFNACSGSAEACKGIEALTYYGAVVTADSKQTIYALDCASGRQGRKNETQCWSAPMTVTQGASHFQRVETAARPPVTISCDIKGMTKQAVCEEKSTKRPSGATGTISAGVAGSTGVPSSANATVEVTTVKFNETQIYYNELVITKGAEMLSATSSIATKTPVAPTSATNPSTVPTKNSGASLSNTAPVIASLAGVLGLLFAVFAF